MENIIIKIVLGIMVLTLLMMFFKKTGKNIQDTPENIEQLQDIQEDDNDVEITDFSN